MRLWSGHSGEAYSPHPDSLAGFVIWGGKGLGRGVSWLGRGRRGEEKKTEDKEKKGEKGRRQGKGGQTRPKQKFWFLG